MDSFNFISSSCNNDKSTIQNNKKRLIIFGNALWDFGYVTVASLQIDYLWQCLWDLGYVLITFVGFCKRCITAMMVKIMKPD